MVFDPIRLHIDASGAISWLVAQVLARANDANLTRIGFVKPVAAL